MEYLLDTHSFLWFINGDEQLSFKAQQAITEPSATKYISIASFWEIAIKLSLGKLQLDFTFRDLERQVDINGFELLPITFKHAYQVSLLDYHHRDPFDRMIIAQALTEDLTVISRDGHFDKYSKLQLLW